MPIRSLSTRTEVRKGTAVLFVSGDVDLAGSAVLEPALQGAVEAGAPLVVDLTEVEFIDSAGLRALAAAEQRAIAHRGRLLIVPSPEAARVFELSGLDAAFELYDELGAALDAAVERVPAEADD